MLHLNLQILKKRTKNVLENGLVNTGPGLVWERVTMTVRKRPFVITVRNREPAFFFFSHSIFFSFQNKSKFLSPKFCYVNFFFNLDWSKTFSSFGKELTLYHVIVGLTHYQMTNFRLFHTERVCRRQFQIWRKWHKVFQTARKHCGKRKKLLIPSNFFLSHSVFKRLVSQGCQKVSLCGNGLEDPRSKASELVAEKKEMLVSRVLSYSHPLFKSSSLTHYHTMSHFDALKMSSCGKHCEKKRNCL